MSNCTVLSTRLVIIFWNFAVFYHRTDLSLAKLIVNFDKSSLKHEKVANVTFLALSNFTRFMYFVQNILCDFVELAVK